MPSQSDLSAQFNQEPPPQYHYSDSALGLVATKSFPAIVGTADMMLKSAEVTLVGYEKIGSGHCTAIVRGKTADVRLAVEEGSKTADQFGQLISKLVIPRPMPNLEAVFPIGTRLAELAQQSQGYSRLSNRAIGLLETRGFPAMVAGADAMLKAADVQLASYETIGAGLCTAMIRGSVADVAMAVEVGMEEAERVGELHAVMVIPRLLEDLEKTLPVASYWLEEEPQRQSISLPEKQKEPEKQPLSLPQKQEEPEKEPISSEQQQAETEQAETEPISSQKQPEAPEPGLEKQQEPISSEKQQAETEQAETEPISSQKQPEAPEPGLAKQQEEEPEPGLETERTPLSLEKQQENSKPEKEREPLSLEKQQKEPEQEEAPSDREEERPLVELPELEKIDYPQENQQQQQQQKRQQARPPEEED